MDLSCFDHLAFPWTTLGRQQRWHVRPQFSLDFLDIMKVARLDLLDGRCILAARGQDLIQGFGFTEWKMLCHKSLLIRAESK